MKKVLFVAYGFPPVGGAGVQRPVKFIKYLRTFGWEPIVITVANPSVPIIDQTLVKDIPLGMKILYAKTLEPSYRHKQKISSSENESGRHKSILKMLAVMMLIPDAQVLWWVGLIRTLIKTIQEEKPDCSYVTAPPFSSFFPVVFVSKLFGVPSVLDYRDEWSFSRNYLENSVKTKIAKKIDSMMERYALRNADAVTVASPGYKELLDAKYPFALGKVCTITNGYDPADFGVSILGKKKGDVKENYFSVVYTGTIWTATSFASFLGGIRLLALQEPSVSAIIKLRILGRILEEEKGRIMELKKFIQVEELDYQPHENIIHEISSADLLLLTLAPLPGSEKIIPGKTFEYLATSVPILAIIPPGTTAKLLNDEKNVFVVDPEDSKGIAESLASIIRANLNKQKRDRIEKYSRPFLTKQLAELFNIVVDRKLSKEC